MKLLYALGDAVSPPAAVRLRLGDRRATMWNRYMGNSQNYGPLSLMDLLLRGNEKGL